MTRDVGDLVPSAGELLLYQTEDGRTRIEVRFAGETVWLSLKQIAELFQRDKSVISRHLKSIFEEGELRRESVAANSATTALDGRLTRSSTSISKPSSRSAMVAQDFPRGRSELLLYPTVDGRTVEGIFAEGARVEAQRVRSTYRFARRAAASS